MVFCLKQEMIKEKKKTNEIYFCIIIAEKCIKYSPKMKRIKIILLMR